MRFTPESKLRRFYISLPVDNWESLRELGDIAEGLKRQLWPSAKSKPERRRYNVYDNSKVHVTLWACDLAVGEKVLKERLRKFMYKNRGRFVDLRIRFNKLSYLAKTETRYIVACLDPDCRKRIEELKRSLEKSFRDLGMSLLERDTYQLHCSIVACTNLNVNVDLLGVLGDFRESISAIDDIRPTRLIVTSKWNVLACGTFLDGSLKCIPHAFSSRPVIHDTVEYISDSFHRTVELINFPTKPELEPIQLLLLVAQLVGYRLDESQIEKCWREPEQFFHVQSRHRTNQRSPDIIAVFVSGADRDAFLRCVRIYWRYNKFMVYASDLSGVFDTGSRITVVPQLPTHQKYLLGKVKRFKAERGFKHCWLDGRDIYLRRDDASPLHRIRSIDDLRDTDTQLRVCVKKRRINGCNLF